MNKTLSPGEELALNLKVASSLFTDVFEKSISSFGITGSQYNVLRILRGVYPEGHARCEIFKRMIDKSPDITRLIDRLEKQGLVERIRTTEDRRMSISKITEKGLELVNKLQPVINEANKLITENLTDNECKQLSEKIEKTYEKLI